MRAAKDPNSDFRCLNCGGYVSSDALLAGVGNRNHCPYCLWSRHLDQFTAGDRLSACKALMEPVGLAFKRREKKYGPEVGELMLVHGCTGCGRFSINRIAADDHPEAILEVFAASSRLARGLKRQLLQEGIRVLGRGSERGVMRQLHGEGARG